MKATTSAALRAVAEVRANAARLEVEHDEMDQTRLQLAEAVSRG